MILNKPINTDTILGNSFEGYIMNATNSKGLYIIYVRDEETHEIDMVDIQKRALYEIKLANKQNKSYEKNLRDDKWLKKFELENYSKNSIYTGETNYTDDEIVKYINFEEYLDSIDFGGYLREWDKQVNGNDLEWNRQQE